MKIKKIILFANTDWYLYNFRLALANEMKKRGNKVVLISPSGGFVKKIIDFGFKWLRIDVSRRGLNPAKEIYTFLKLVILYKKEYPDLVHHFTIKPVLYGSLAAKIARVPCIVNAITGLGHLFTDKSLKTLLLRSIVIFLYRLALRNTKTIFQNPDDRDLFINLKLVSENDSYLILGSGVDINKFTPSDNALHIEPFTVVFASRLLWSKGVKEVIEAAEILWQRGVNISVKIAGSLDIGNPAGIPKDIVESWSKPGRVDFLGHINEICSLYNKADLVVLPSYYGEGVPRMLIEAAACGVPLIATDMPGCREIVKHGLNGFLIPPKDSVALAEAIHNLVTNRRLCLIMGEQSRKIACESFSEAEVLQKTIDVYQC